MPYEPTMDNLSEALGFRVSEGFANLISSAIASSPHDPQAGLSSFGLTLGGPFYTFVGGSPQSLRTTQTPPEFFPFAVAPGRTHTTIGFLVDNPSLEKPPCTTFALYVPGQPQRCGVVARNEKELIEWLKLQADHPDHFAPPVNSLNQKSCHDDPQQERYHQVTYRTADRLGVVVQPENAPLELLHEEFRCHLIEKRDPDKVREVGLTALKVGAPGAALALARDITWWLGHRSHWYAVAAELYEQAYSELSRPLLQRIARREWTRFYGRRPLD